MKLAFTTLGCPDWTLEQIAANAKDYGYDGVELRVADDGVHLSPDATGHEVARVAKLFRDADMPVFSLCGYAKFVASDPAAIEANQRLARRLIEIANALGARCIRVYGGALEEGDTVEAAVKRVAAAIAPVGAEAAAQGVRLAIETHDAWCSGADLAKVFDAVDTAGVGALFDVHNTFGTCGEWQESYGLLKSHISYWHLKDGFRTPDGKNHHAPVGAGELPLRDILAQLKQDGFDGYLSFEWEKRWAPELDAPEHVFPQYAYKVRATWDDV